MAIVFELKGKKAVYDMKEFCRLKKELTYVGRFANKETSKIIPGTIIQYNGKFYTTEIPFHTGLNFSIDEEGLVTTFVRLFKTDYIPEECKPIGNCPIHIHIWNIDIDDKGPICSYAFYNSQMKKAKEVVENNKNVDILINGVNKDRNDFLNS